MDWWPIQVLQSRVARHSLGFCKEQQGGLDWVLVSCVLLLCSHTGSGKARGGSMSSLSKRPRGAGVKGTKES